MNLEFAVSPATYAVVEDLKKVKRIPIQVQQGWETSDGKEWTNGMPWPADGVVNPKYVSLPVDTLQYMVLQYKMQVNPDWSLQYQHLDNLIQCLSNYPAGVVIHGNTSAYYANKLGVDLTMDTEHKAAIEWITNPYNIKYYS